MLGGCILPEELTLEVLARVPIRGLVCLAATERAAHSLMRRALGRRMGVARLVLRDLERALEAWKHYKRGARPRSNSWNRRGRHLDAPVLLMG